MSLPGMFPISVDGLSCVGAFGTGPQALCDAVRSCGEGSLSLRADVSGLAAYFPARALRGADRFSRLALYGGCLALSDAAVSFAADGADLDGWGIILASGYGPVTPTLDFLDSLLAHGQAMASPLAFSHSVHNIPAAVIAKSLNIVGPCATICGIENPVASGLLLAGGWLAEERVERVLFGAVDEMTPTLARTTERLITERPVPDYPSRKDRPVTDGACFFCLSLDGRGARGLIQEVSLAASSRTVPARIPAQADIRFLSGAVSPQARAEMNALDGGAAYGNLPVAQAFDCVAALSMLRPGGRAVCSHYDKGLRGDITLCGKAL